MTNEVSDLARRHEQWREKECISRIPSENAMSPSVLSLLSSDLGHRYTSRHSFYMRTRFTNEIEEYGEKLAQGFQEIKYCFKYLGEAGTSTIFLRSHFHNSRFAHERKE